MSAHSIRTQIYLSREQHRRLKERAKKTHQSMATLIRTAIEQYLQHQEAEKMLSPNDPIFDIIGRGESDVTDLSVAHDKYLYSLEQKP